jgi:hypothetical protein
MIIRSKQLETLAKYSRQRFDDAVAGYLRSNHPHEHVSQDASELARFIKEGVDKGASYGITREMDVIRLLEVLLVTGMDFEASDSLRWVADYLREPVDAELRLDNVIERLHFATPSRG